MKTKSKKEVKVKVQFTNEPRDTILLFIPRQTGIKDIEDVRKHRAIRELFTVKEKTK